MSASWPIGVDHHSQPTRLQRVAHMPQECLRRLHLMVHVHQEDAVERLMREQRVVRRAELHGNIVETLALDALRKIVASFRNDVLRQHAASSTNGPCQAHRIIALARPNVGDRHPGLDAGDPHHFFSFAEPIARVLGRKGVADNWRNLAMGLRELRLRRLRAATGDRYRAN